MTDSANDPVSTQLASEVFVSPLRAIAVEAHEMFGELTAVGFSEQVATKIVSQMVSDSMLYKDGEYEISIIEDEDDELDEDDEADGQFN